MEILLKALLGAAMAVGIHFAARSRHPHLAALIPLFPTFMLFAQITFIATDRMATLRPAALFGLLSLLPYALYLILVWWASQRLNVWAALVLGIGGWIAAASALLALWRTYSVPA